MERWIAGGRVRVNDSVAHVGQRVSADDRILVDDKPLRRQTAGRQRVLVYNKPVGEVCTRSDPEGRPTVFDRLPPAGHGRWISIGRLDIATSGLLLLTNDGALANRMMHPSTGLDREYAVRVNGLLTDEQLTELVTGIEDEGELLAFSDIQHYDGRGTNHWYHVVLMEGRNREIRRLFEHCGLMVSRLKRVRFGPVVLPSRLARGRFEALGEDDMASLYGILRLPYEGRPLHRKSRRDSMLIPYPELPA
jgi:23S rRNA pseudouridine2605 synthase